jgi:hypothetical protein
MKTSILMLCIAMCVSKQSSGQAAETSDQVIEGGKLFVELVKALSGNKQSLNDPGCKGKYADLCIENESANSITVQLEHRVSAIRREVVVLPRGRECFLQAQVGVWTYDLRNSGSTTSIRKGDLLIEGCNNMVMNIK